jgi:PII-like signaling protein
MFPLKVSLLRVAVVGALSFAIIGCGESLSQIEAQVVQIAPEVCKVVEVVDPDVTLDCTVLDPKTGSPARTQRVKMTAARWTQMGGALRRDQ